MVFWIGLAVVLVVFVVALSWGIRGIGGRWLTPGTQYMNRPRKGSGAGPLSD